MDYIFYEGSVENSRHAFSASTKRLHTVQHTLRTHFIYLHEQYNNSIILILTIVTLSHDNNIYSLVSTYAVRGPYEIMSCRLGSFDFRLFPFQKKKLAPF